LKLENEAEFLWKRNKDAIFPMLVWNLNSRDIKSRWGTCTYRVEVTYLYPDGAKVMYLPVT
jgi:hypothetical protein